MTYAVTLDFHNTLAHCESWFELEVRGLLVRFLEWHASETGTAQTPETLESAATVYREIRKSVIESGYELTAEACVATGLERLSLHAAEVDIARGVKYLMHGALHDLTPVPGALELVDELGRAGIRLGIVSSAVYHPYLEWSLDAFGISDAFVSVVTSASAGFYKSRTEIYFHALRQLDVVPERAVHVGDSWRWDAGTAKQAGMKTVWFNAKQAEAEIIPDLEIRILEGAAPLIIGLLGLPTAAER